MSALKPGSWRPAHLTSADTLSLTSVLVVISFLYSGDYFFGQDRTTGTLSIIENAFPLWLWGTFAVAGGAALLAGIIAKIHAVVWVSHLWLCAIYAALTVGSFLTAATSQWDGVRGVGVLFFVSLMHGLFCVRMDAKPRAK